MSMAICIHITAIHLLRSCQSCQNFNRLQKIKSNSLALCVWNNILAAREGYVLL